MQARTPVLPRTFKYFFYKNKESEIFEKAQNYLCDIAVGIYKNISAQSDKVGWGPTLARRYPMYSVDDLNDRRIQKLWIRT